MSIQTLTVQGVPAVRTHTSFTDKNLGTQAANTTKNVQVGGNAANTGNVAQTLTVSLVGENCTISNPKFRNTASQVTSGNTVTIAPGDNVVLFVDVTTPPAVIGEPDVAANFTVSETWS